MATVKEIMEFRLKETQWNDLVLIHRGSRFSVEHIEEPTSLLHCSQVIEKWFSEFITAGITRSLNEKVFLSDVSVIIKQSLHIPLRLEILMQKISMQERLTECNSPCSTILFLGTRLHFIQCMQPDSTYSSHFSGKESSIFYPALHFEDVTLKKGFWHLSLVNEKDARTDFRVAVYF